MTTPVSGNGYDRAKQEGYIDKLSAEAQDLYSSFKAHLGEF